MYIDSWIEEDIIARADLHIVTNQARFASNYVYHAIEMGAEYAIRWINGEVDKGYIDLDVLTEIGREIIHRETGEPVGVSLERHPDHPNFILAMMDFIVY